MSERGYNRHEQDDRVWGADVGVDEELRLLARRDSLSADAVIREAFLLLEHRIRSITGLPDYEFGAELIDKALLDKSGDAMGRLQPFSPVSAERRGLYELFHGAFMLYRNPVAHRYVYHQHSDKVRILQLVNHLLELASQAAEKVVDVNAYMGHHEGPIAYRRDFRLDIDDDQQDELVLLIETEPIVTLGEATPSSGGTVVILDNDQGKMKRIPAEKLEGGSMYGPLNVQAVKVTDLARPDLVVTWSSGENGEIDYMMRFTGSDYKLTSFKGTTRDSEATQRGLLIRPIDQLQFADFDGDGLAEVIKTTSINGSRAAAQYGYPVDDLEELDDYVTYSLYEVWKWNGIDEVMELTDRRMSRQTSLPGY